ncbi:MAG TPA: hypothetical protein VJU61_15525, partial [Polyangiaceae bacterium]|nr:hypothetical protein [Polyangiaceae bacterium]
RPVSGLQSFALQCAAGLLLGVALVSTLLPSLAALLPRQKPAPVVSAAAAPQAGARRQPWLLLGAFAGVAAFLVWMSPAFQSFNGEIQWVSLIGFVIVFLGLPLVPSLRHLPTWLQRRWPIPSPARSPEPLQRVLDAYLAALVIAYAIALPHWLTAAPGVADRLGPEVLARSEGGQEQPEPYTDLPMTRLEVVLTTPESQLTEAGLARLERLGARLKQAIPSFAVIEPGLFLREAAHQLERPVSLPGPWLAEAGLAGRLLEEYVTDEGHTARLTLLVEPPAQVTPVAFADGMLVESVAWQAKAELPDAEVTVTGPERLVAEAVFDPLRLAGVWVLAIGVAGSFQRLSRRGVPAPQSPPPRPLASSLPPVDHPGRGRTRREDSS